MLNGKPVDFICNNCLLQQIPQIDIFDTKDLDNNITHNSTITAHVTNVPEEKENMFECVSICRHRSQEIALLVAITPLEQFVQGFLDCLFGGPGFMCMSPLRNLKGMHFIHVNARSILPKMSELRIMAKESKAAVIAISETWLDSSVINSEIQIEDY
jgi:hypothetical protein